MTQELLRDQSSLPAQVIPPGFDYDSVPELADELRETSVRRRKFFPHVTAYVAAVPTYVGGFMTLGWAAKDQALAATSLATIRTRAERSGILGTTGYWTPEIHIGAFNLPPYIARHLPTE